MVGMGGKEISFGTMTVQVNIFNLSSQPHDIDDGLGEVSYMHELVEDFALQIGCEDPLEACLAHFRSDFDINGHIEKVNAWLGSIPIMSEDRWKPKHVILTPSTTPPKPSIVVPPKLDLKPLPDTLKYVFLGPSQTLPVLIASNMNYAEEELLVKVLGEIGWTIANIKGISLYVVQHKIHLKENVKTSQEPQWRLNPVVKEIVRVKVLRLFGVGVIYPIFNSSWVSPI